MFAPVRFLTSVGSHVISQMIASCETFFTLRTLIRFLASMDPYVLNQVLAFKKTLAAMSTLHD